MPLIDVPTVHAVTDATILADPGFKAKAASVFRALGRRGAIHLRAPAWPAAAIYELASALAPMQDETGGWLVINDRVDVGLAAAARGVQLRETSLDVRDALTAAHRTTGGLGRAICFGVSVHDANAARSAAAGGASWVMAGSVYATASHPGGQPQGEAFIQEIATCGVPVIAIGGIQPSHSERLRSLGAHGVAAIRGIWDTPDPARAAAAYL